MQNCRWLVAFPLGQQMCKSAFNFREIAELDYPNCPFLLGNALGLDLRLCGPQPMPGFQRKRARIYRIGRCAYASVLVENRIHLAHFVWPKRPCFHDREHKIRIQCQRR